MPVAHILRTCRRLKTVALSAHDCTLDVFRILPPGLKSVLICSHLEFSPLDICGVAAGLEFAPLAHLRTLTLYDPSAVNARFDQVINDQAWDRAKARGTKVSMLLTVKNREWMN